MKSTTKRKLKWYGIAFVAIIVPVAAIVIVKGKQFAPAPAFAFPPETITATEAQAMVWEQSVATVASLTASQGVLISSEVPGTVSKLNFTSGQTVEAGEALFELDSSTERAQLEAAQATFDLAQINLKRAKDLKASNTISQSELDTALAQAAQASAEVERIKATLKKKSIKAPFAGKLGIRQIDLGEYLNPGTAAVSLQTLDPLYADFSLSQRQIGAVGDGYPVKLSVDAFPGMEFEGTLEAIGSELDAKTRMLQARATIPNPDETLRPGMFAKIKVIQPESVDVVAVPSTAISYQSFGNSVFVVTEAEGSKVVSQRFVTLGENRGDYVEIKTGLEAGETVATSAVFKLFEGRSVTIDNSKAITASLNPQPEDA